MDLRTARRLNNISQYQLADRVKVTQPMISFWERGMFNIPKNKRRRIEKLLGIPIEFHEKPRKTKNSKID